MAEHKEVKKAGLPKIDPDQDGYVSVGFPALGDRPIAVIFIGKDAKEAEENRGRVEKDLAAVIKDSEPVFTPQLDFRRPSRLTPVAEVCLLINPNTAEEIFAWLDAYAQGVRRYAERDPKQGKRLRGQRD